MPIGSGASGITNIRDAADISLSNPQTNDVVAIDSFGDFTNADALSSKISGVGVNRIEVVGEGEAGTESGVLYIEIAA